MLKKGTLLVVDDSHNILAAVKMLAESAFENVVTISNPNSIPARLRTDKPDVVLLDMNFVSGVNTGNEGLYWLRQIKSISRSVSVVLFTAYADINLAVTGMRDGADDFIVKPFENKKMLETLLNARDKMSPSTAKKQQSAMFWGDSPAMKSLRTVAEKVAATDANILITGENGTGKEMLAKEIHRMSLRSSRSMVAIDMGAVSETLFESELFGHMKGAFTDAKSDKQGKFELAEGGTLFLDEIGNLPYSLQAKLLTALQRRAIVRVGGTEQIPINVRLLCATNRNLDEMVAEGSFREDLLYRINTIRLHLPSLRERRDDIVPLAKLFLEKYATTYNKAGTTLSDEAAQKLTRQPWYGNIRELQHAMEKAVILSEGETINADDIDEGRVRPNDKCDTATTIVEMERNLIMTTMKECAGNMAAAAARLGISRQTLYNKLKKYGL